jgi:Cft2 family RNA processing exonuclease
MAEPDEVESIKGGVISRKMSVDEISFSAHVDFAQNAEFIELVKAQHVVSAFYSFPCRNSLFVLGLGAWGADRYGASEISYDS